MAKLERTLTGSPTTILKTIENYIYNSVSATLEDQSQYTVDGVTCIVRVYERYSIMGGNRLSLNLTLVSSGDQVFLSAISSGGSQAVFFKLNTLGENAFLNSVRKALEELQ